MRRELGHPVLVYDLLRNDVEQAPITFEDGVARDVAVVAFAPAGIDDQAAGGNVPTATVDVGPISEPEKRRGDREDQDGHVVIESVEDLVASCYSASGSAPHLFGSRRDDFEHDLIDLLDAASPTGMFAERVRDAELVVWRK